MSSQPNVVVIGAGTLGMCTAINLIERGAQVTVIEANSIASGSSGRSVGVIGTQFTDKFDIQLRAHTFRHFGAWERDGFKINRIGYMRLARTETQMELFEASVELQRQAGFSSQLCMPEDIKKIVPHMSLDGLAGAIFGPNDGFIDPYELCTFLADRVRNRGGVVRQACKLLDAKTNIGGWRLETSKGEIYCDVAVNAAGAWAPQVARILGQDLHLTPERHEAVSIHLEQPLDYTMPMVMDLVNGEGTGLNFRHEKARELIAEIHRVKSWLPEDPDRYNDQCEDESKYELAEMLMERLPELPGASLGRGWAGLYPVSADGKPLVGPIDARDLSVITAAGAGGYGIQLAPVIGQLTADWVLDGSPASLPEASRLIPTVKRNVPRTQPNQAKEPVQ
ncbi:FAD-binding oxidoreductase [Paracoccus pantotrophus]|uniref:FAD-binding oxidoreductase n=1 Tax=Paracoccus pantotrophus TaxID=82367 RepID=A0A7H9BQG2_PARPN|nr:FAD-binding oxidoreductase [Paracoccus pantotrophus]QLH13065.1 FAD-binding oxidoreductase [Paracoccus pantotrophus]